MIEIPQRVDFMRRIHLFYKLEEAQLESVAEKAHERTCEPGEVIFRQGEIGDSFFMIYSGSVKVGLENQLNGKALASLVPGDYFGEEALLRHHARTATISAAEKTVLLVLSQQDFKLILKKAHQLKANFEVAVSSHRLARRMKFKWLREDEGEVIYFLARKHPVLLFRAMLPPVLIGAIAFSGLVFGLLAALPWLLWLCVVGLGLTIGWGVWNGVDWGNDYYIVTNQRVVWLEKVVGIYDSRQEAPLTAIQRINVQTEFVGRQLDYGNLIVRTIVGTTLVLRNLNHPHQAAALVDEHWKRSKLSSRKMEEEAMRQALRARLLGEKTVPEPVPSLLQESTPKKKSPLVAQRGLGNFFRIRFEDFSTITYRKHWIVLVEKTWLPSLALLALIFWLVYDLVHISLSGGSALFSNLGLVTLLFLWLTLFAVFFVWWFYQYVDWRNDVFQVTPDQILDISKKPLGEVTSDIAALDNILHLEYERKGIMQVLFNYGNVYITIGGGKDMTFEDVYNPSAVQDDIERRRLERSTQKEQGAIKAERERVADWFAAYHRSQEEFRQAEAETEKSTDEADEEDTTEDADW